jgi:hypothetical protein
MIMPQNDATITARRLSASAVILCMLLFGFFIDRHALQGAVGMGRAAAQTPRTQEKTVTIPIEGMV